MIDYLDYPDFTAEESAEIKRLDNAVLDMCDGTKPHDARLMGALGRQLAELRIRIATRHGLRDEEAETFLCAPPRDETH